MTRLDMAQWIVDAEARRDRNNKLKVYPLPANDGGGSYEVAGINEKYDPTMAEKLKGLIEKGRQDEAEKLAVSYIADNTEDVKTWQNNPAVEFYLRDCCFNRGLRGAGKILQLAINVKPVDGVVGPLTRAALKAFDTKSIVLLVKLRMARQYYEEHIIGTRPNFAQGLENRWDNALEHALALEYMTGAGGLVAA